MKNSNWYEQVAALRGVAEQEPHRAGTDALRIFEDWLYEEAQSLGWPNERGGMREFIDYITARERLSQEEAARGRRFADVRNCLAHRGGLLISPALADELLDFIETLFRRGGLDAEHLMTPQARCVEPDDSLREARDLMLRHSISTLPVLKDGKVVGVLTNRDLVALQASQGSGERRGGMKVKEAMSADSLEKVQFIRRDTPYEEVLRHVQKSNTAVLVTKTGSSKEPLLGIITVSDILTKL
jgi:CBS domain-containing protein